MSEKLSITCDFCNKELVVDSPYPHSYGLHLSVKDHNTNSLGEVYCIKQNPPINSPKDFCGIKCLTEWVVKQRI